MGGGGYEIRYRKSEKKEKIEIEKEKGEKEQVTKRKCYKERGAGDSRGEKKDK